MAAEANTELLLVRWQDGELAARDRLIARLHPELSRVASARLRGDGHASLSTGDLINETVIQFLKMHGENPANRGQFMALASRMMRNILADHARSKNALKRPSPQGRARHPIA